MASIRKLKKEVNYLAYEVLTEAFAFKHFHPELDENKFDDVIRNIVKSRNDIISRINNPGDAENPENLNQHFNKVREDLSAMVKELENLG